MTKRFTSTFAPHAVVVGLTATVVGRGRSGSGATGLSPSPQPDANARTANKAGIFIIVRQQLIRTAQGAVGITCPILGAGPSRYSQNARGLDRPFLAGAWLSKL